MSFEEQLVEYCAPTLAGLKVGSLFRYVPEADARMEELIFLCNQRLAGKGVCLTALGKCPRGQGYLVYLYRPGALAAVMSEGAVTAFLGECGYDSSLPELALSRLSQRMEGGCFPHEIGVFLGYPLEDVLGFIENGGQNYRCCGCWKVYGDPGRANRQFARFRRCTTVYRRLHRRGVSLERLTVAA